MRENLDPILTDPDFLALPPEQDFLSQFRTMDTVPEEEAQWLVPGYIPQGQITLLAADGGVGKTSFWCQLLAALSTGRRTLLEEVSPKWDSDFLSEKTDTPAETMSAKQDTPHKERWGAFFSTEDSVRKKLKKKLRLAGAKMMNLITLESSSTALLELRLGSPELSDFIHSYRPALCVLDPIQGFLPHGVNMAARNEIRECLAPLMALGEQVGTAFLLVCHTNKRAGAWGRTRLADSADLWDAARSVLMMGDAGDGRRYLSQEKNNYGPLQPTRLYTFSDSGLLVPAGLTQKRDREFQLQAQPSAAPKREGCKEFLLQKLEENGGSLPAKELEELAREEGYTKTTVRHSKGELKDSGFLRFRQECVGREKRWWVESLVPPMT